MDRQWSHFPLQKTHPPRLDEKCLRHCAQQQFPAGFHQLSTSEGWSLHQTYAWQCRNAGGELSSNPPGDASSVLQRDCRLSPIAHWHTSNYPLRHHFPAVQWLHSGKIIPKGQSSVKKEAIAISRYSNWSLGNPRPQNVSPVPKPGRNIPSQPGAWLKRYRQNRSQLSHNHIRMHHWLL